MLIILVLILLIIIFFLRIEKTQQENFVEFRQESINPQSPPLLETAKNVPQMYSLQRIYPYNGIATYDVGNYPNVTLPGEVVGCGSRREPCYGGSQQVVNNILPPLDISNKNIAPRNGHIGPYPPFSQVGYLYKIMHPQNIYKPLYLKRVKNVRFPKYEYFTMTTNGEQQKVIIPNIHRELGTNDQVRIEGEEYFYRVTVNESNFPSYPRISKF